MNVEITFAPLIAWQIVAGFGAVAILLILFGALNRSRGMLLRTLVVATLVLALFNPRVVQEKREPRPDVGIVVVDESPSQRVGERRAQAEAVVRHLTEAAERYPDLDLRVVRERGGGPDDAEEGTPLFRALDQALTEVPAQRFAGAVLVTDGQVHDVPEDSKRVRGPLHVLVTGTKGEKDRRLIIETAPTFGLVGQEVGIRYRVEDRISGSPGNGARARVILRQDGVPGESSTVSVGSSDVATVTLEHAGPTVIELRVEPVEGELSTLNNRVAVSVNGIRERLRVLLVSGQPHAGERTWRNLLKSDPSVDLVHFTILRPPEKDDLTPLRELSLIVFPIQELFAVKLHDFNLIVFDRYVVRDVLPPSYLRNIADYVRKGGALLMSMGPEFASRRSLFNTPLGEVMPAAPTGQVLEVGYTPDLTDIGNRHPVSATLPGIQADAPPRWGRWLRQIDVQPRSGHVLMKGLEERPLLVLDRVGEGRVAQLMSDHSWLWARGFENGGPYAELLRRIAHWLMKEPDLEEERLRAGVAGGRLTIERGSLLPDMPPVTVTAPSGETRDLTLTPAGGGVARAVVPAEETGLYRVEDGERTALAASGALNPVEFADLRASDEALGPLIQAMDGSLRWLVDDETPELRRIRPQRDSSGRGWLGLVRNEAYAVVGKSQISLLPGLLVLAVVLGGLLGAWYREGR